MLSVPKRTIQKIANLFGYKIVPIWTYSDTYNPDLVMAEELREILKKCRKYTKTSEERIYALHKAVKYIVSSKIPGDFVECGVWRGGSAMVVAYSLLEMGETNRKIYLYDTFEGMSEPTKDDYLLSDKSVSAESELKKGKVKGEDIWCLSSLSEVRNNMLSTGYPEDKLVFIKGKVEDTIPKTMPLKISLLRLDTDWYESTKHELTYLFPILVQNGVLLIDDYGHWAGSKKATDEYFSVNKIPILLNRVDYTARLGIKL
jgi:hypothetical protein